MNTFIQFIIDIDITVWLIDHQVSMTDIKLFEILWGTIWVWKLIIGYRLRARLIVVLR